jgi:hypothetical protein
MIEAGLISALGAFFILLRFNIRRVAGYATFIDIAVTALFCVLFLGTYAGMMTGIFAGVIVSLMLNAIRFAVGYERGHLRRKRGHILPSMVWVRVPGRFS